MESPFLTEQTQAKSSRAVFIALFFGLFIGLFTGFLAGANKDIMASNIGTDSIAMIATNASVAELRGQEPAGPRDDCTRVWCTDRDDCTRVLRVCHWDPPDDTCYTRDPDNK